MAFRSSSSIATTTGGDTSLTVTAPAGVAQNDIVLLLWVNGGSNTSTITWPSGFTEFADASVATPDTKTVKLAWKREGSSPPANYQVTSDIGGGDKCVLVAGAWSGRHTSTAPTAVITSQTSATSSPITVATTGFTAATGDDAAWFVTSVSPEAAWDYTAPASFTEREDRDADFYSSACLASRDNLSSGATGSISGSMAAPGNTAGWSAYVVQLPAAAGTSYSLTVDKTDLLFAGQNVTLTPTGNLTLSVENASIAFSGQDLPFQLAVPETTTATLQFTGQDVTLTFSDTADYTLTVDMSPIAFTGQSITLTASGNQLVSVDVGSLILSGSSITLTYSGGVSLPAYITSALFGSYLFKVTKVFVVSTTGRTKWVDYIPVKQVVDPAVTPNSTANPGGIAVSILGSVTGLTAWVDYVPVVEVVDDNSGAWRTDNTGFIPIIPIVG